MNMHPADVLAMLDKLAKAGVGRVDFAWLLDGVPDANIGPAEWAWNVEDKHGGPMGYGTAPTFTEAAYAVFAALDKERGA